MAVLQQKQRNKLDNSDFALPNKRAYPIHDESHARAALSLGARYATPEEYKKIKGVVSKRYPNIGQHGMKQPKRASSKPYYD